MPIITSTLKSARIIIEAGSTSVESSLAQVVGTLVIPDALSISGLGATKITKLYAHKLTTITASSRYSAFPTTLTDLYVPEAMRAYISALTHPLPSTITVHYIQADGSITS